MCMQKSALILALALVPPCSVAQVRNYQSSGNLQSSHDIGCISSEEARNVYTPADLYRGTAECIRKKKMERAVYLSALAGVYARFDALRVSDPTAVAAEGAVHAKYMGALSQKQLDAFYKALTETASDEAALGDMCRGIERVGAPAYDPQYMIGHGLQAFSERKTSGLKDDFDAEKPGVMRSPIFCIAREHGWEPKGNVERPATEETKSDRTQSRIWGTTGTPVNRDAGCSCRT